MSRRNKIIYWVATIWLALGMLSTGAVQLFGMKEEVEMIQHLGYPQYLLLILGISKILGVIVVLAPKLSRLKEWAYAGFFFTMAGAIISHLAVNDPITKILPCVLLLILITVSWYFRPSERKLTT